LLSKRPATNLKNYSNGESARELAIKVTHGRDENSLREKGSRKKKIRKMGWREKDALRWVHMITWTSGRGHRMNVEASLLT